MKQLIAAFFITANSAILANTQLGNRALSFADGVADVIAIGKSTASATKNSSHSIFIGNHCGYLASNLNSVVAIGDGALVGARNLSGVVAIGDNELANVGGLGDTTSINKQQIFVSRVANAFAINPLQKTSITNTPFYYINDTLYFNVKKIEGMPISRSEPAKAYNFYLAPDGDDENDGLSYKCPKKTFDGVWKAANALDDTITNITCAVFAGTYYIDYTNTVFAFNFNRGFCVNKRVHFIALDGPEKTSVSGPEDNFSRSCMASLGVSMGDTYYDSAPKSVDFRSNGGVIDAVIYRRQTLEGFTVRKFAATFAGNQYQKTAPTFSGIDFKNCIIRDNMIMHAGWGAGGVYACRFYDCDVIGNVLYHTGGADYCCIYNYCDFFRTRIIDNEIYIPDGHTGQLRYFRYGGIVKNTYLYQLVPPNSTPNTIRTTPMIASEKCDSTIAFVSTNGTSTVTTSYGNNATNVLYVFDTKLTTTNGVDTVTMTSADFAKYHDLDTGVAVSIDSPAVRLDGKADAGWKDSGLNARKILSTRADIRVVDGVLVVYQNGEMVGTIEMSALPVMYRNTSNAQPSSITPNEQPDLEEEEDHEQRVMIAPR